MIFSRVSNKSSVIVITSPSELFMIHYVVEVEPHEGTATTDNPAETTETSYVDLIVSSVLASNK